MVRIVAVGALMMAASVLACSGGGGTKVFTTSSGSDRAQAGGARQDGRLALVRDQRLLVRVGNGDERMVFRTPPNTFPAFPVWSPDGKRIAFVQSVLFFGQPNSDWGGDIYLIDAGGGDPQLLLKHDQPGATIQGLAWTPDGAALLFGYQLTLIKDGKFEGQTQRLERLEIATGNRTRVIDDAILPSLTRDGTRLAYMKQDSMGIGGLFVSAADGSDAKQVLELGAKYVGILGPRIAPDGSAIAFAGVVVPGRGSVPQQREGPRAVLHWLLPRTASAHGLPMDVWTVNAVDGAVTQLTNIKEDEPYPAWSPDGRTITVFATGGLYQMNADGSNLKKVGEGAFGGQADMQ